MDKRAKNNKNLVSFRLNGNNMYYIDENGIKDTNLSVYLNKALDFHRLWVTNPKKFLCKVRVIRPELYKAVGRIQFLQNYIEKWLN